MSIDWNQLRPLNGDKREAFEELCCQLAYYEQVPEGSIFERKGKPDGGVECYWKYPNGDEWGWQAKYFPNSPNNDQWGQIDKSVKTFLEKHSAMTRCTVALPVDLPDARIDGQDSARVKWNNHVQKWQEWAHALGRSIDFDYWGEHQIWERLARQEHRGRYYFWFHKEFFGSDWFQERLAIAIQNADERYTPRSNVELPINQIFDGIGRTPPFFARIQTHYSKLRKVFADIAIDDVPDVMKEKHTVLINIIPDLLHIGSIIQQASVETELDWQKVVKLITKALEIAQDCDIVLQQIRRQHPSKDRDNLNYLSYLLRQLISTLNDVYMFAQSNEAILSNRAALLVIGEWGKGKTHLFCNIAERRVNVELPTILLLGQHFIRGNPWTQIYNELGLSGIQNEHEFLGALEAAAQLRGCKALILIDALNEGDGPRLWHDRLPGILQTLSNYPWISLAISVRSTYKDLIIPDSLLRNEIVVRIEHYGFAGHEYEALQTFFDNYGIEQPSVPLMNPEFQTPLFLKIFCEGLRKKNLTRIPSGLQGITTIFDFFVQAIQDKLEREFDVNPKYVKQAINRLIEAIASQSKRWLLLEESEEIVNAIMPYRSEQQTKSLHYLLVAEGLLARDAFLVRDGNENKRVEGVRFTYERLSDHLIVQSLWNTHLKEKPIESFLSVPQLSTLVADKAACTRYSGLIEALSIQLPELTGKELVEIVPDIAAYVPIRDAFVESLLWRKSEAIGAASKDYIDQHVLKHRDSLEAFLNVLLTISLNPDHPYNADFLHMHLIGFEMAERDARWSIFLHEQYGTQNAVNRLIDWAWSPNDKNHIEDESIRLCGKALAWFLTTSNRFVRDRATKALVNLFTERIPILCQLIPDFLQVNDPYVLERLMAVAYGCVMRSRNNEHITMLAQLIYEWIFVNGEPPSHILLRDYARGVVELAVNRQLLEKVDPQKFRPPYTCKWPESIPTEQEIRQYYKWPEEGTDAYFAMSEIYESVMGFGDFARYIIGTNNTYSFKWSSQLLSEPSEISAKEKYQSFLQSLSETPSQQWEVLMKARNLGRTLKNMPKADRAEIFDLDLDDEELETEVELIEKNLRSLLNQEQVVQFEGFVLPYIDNPHEDRNEFDLSLIQHWIVKQVFDLGWTPQKFGKFDRWVNYHDRGSRYTQKAERISKKYQWIAFLTCLAYLADNFKFKGEPSSGRENIPYDGPWQDMHIRDIDPSFILKKTPQDISWRSHTTSWWAKTKYDEWEVDFNKVDWLKNKSDLPNIKSLIEVVNPEDDSRWLTLEANYRWTQKSPDWDDSFKMPRKDIVYWLQSYIVKQSDIDELCDWAIGENLHGKRLPESYHLTQVFLGEFYWSPAFAYHNVPYYHHDGWVGGETDDLFPKKVLVTSDQYLQEDAGYDCSIDEGIHIYLPCQWIVEQMGLNWAGVEGHFFNKQGKLIAFDPSVKTSGPGVLLINRTEFLSFLHGNGYDILWIVTGEKQFIGGGHRYGGGRLEMSGAFRIQNNEIIGELVPTFRPWE